MAARALLLVCILISIAGIRGALASEDFTEADPDSADPILMSSIREGISPAASTLKALLNLVLSAQTKGTGCIVGVPCDIRCIRTGRSTLPETCICF